MPVRLMGRFAISLNVRGTDPIHAEIGNIIKGPASKVKQGPFSQDKITLQQFKGFVRCLDGFVEVFRGMGDAHEAGFVL